MTFTVHPAASPIAFPLQVVVRGVPTGERLRDFAHRRFAYALGRFGARLRDADVWLEDVNGPRRGVDKHCRIELRLRPRGRVTVTAEAENEYAAVTRAVKRCAAVLDRSNKRRWMSRSQRGKRRTKA
jgi:hypothetical protein